MAELSQTPGSVAVTSGEVQDIVFGGTITAGMPLYRDTDSLYKAADNTSAAKAAVKGIAINGGASGQPGRMVKPGTPEQPAIINLGATLSLAKAYALGATAGSIMPVDDITNTVYVTTLGAASSTSLLNFSVSASGQIAAAAVS
jgi:hypothetical protein